jgi:serine/threonine protein kinase/tetratricopeptide (TPR) repeat protein
VLEPGTLVGRFRVEALLGRGGMGEVYQAWDPTLERSVALKSLQAGGSQESEALERFRREALVLAQLNHPNVCQVHDWVDDPRGTFIAMELLEGETLDQAATHLRPLEKLQVIRSVAMALEAAHAKGIVHRDLKPVNIMVAPERDAQGPRVKVLDFGLARLVTARPAEELTSATPIPNLALLEALEAADLTQKADSQETALHRSEPSRKEVSGSHSWERLTQVGIFMGSPSYASPEQIQGQVVGPSGDIFALGILAWELLTGEHPFPGTGRARMRAIVEGSRRSLKGQKLPSGTTDLLKAMLDTRPAKRPTATQVVAGLERLVRPRHLLRWITVSCLGALALAGAANWFLGRGIIADLTRQRPARLLVFPFLNGTGDPQLDATAHIILPEMLEASLRENPRLAPLDLETIAKARTALRMSPQAAPHPEEQAHLVTALGAQLVLRGSLTKKPDGAFVLAYELSDGTGRVRTSGAAQSTVKVREAYLALVRSVAKDLLKAVDPFAARRHPLPEVPATALEAYSKGAEWVDRGHFKEAVPYFQAAAQAAPDYAPAVMWYARCLSRLAEAPPEPVFQWARWAARAQGDRVYEMRALHQLSARYSSQGQIEASDQTCREALDLALELGDAVYEAGIHTTLGVNRQRQHQPQEAEAQYRKALALDQAAGLNLDASRVLNNLAVIERERGDVKGAEARYLEALHTIQSYGDKWGEAIVTNNLGDLALTQEGGLDKAEAFYLKAQALREAIGDQNGLAYTLMGLASVYQARGNLSRAQGLERQFLDLARKTQQRPLEALGTYNLGELSRTAGNYPAARDYYRQALVMHQELKDATMEAHCLAGEAECLAREGRTGMARALLDRSQALSPESTPYLLRAQGWLARKEGRSEEAKALFTRALREAPVQAPEIVRELKEALR